MKRARWLVLGGVVVAAGIAACSTPDPGPVLGISATGTVSGTVFFDRNGDKVNNAGDTVLGGVRVRLLPQGSHDTLGKATTDAAGFFKIRDLPVGSYRVVVDSGGIAGDSIALTRIIRDTFTPGPNHRLPRAPAGGWGRPQGQPWAQPTADRPTISVLLSGASVGIATITSVRAANADGGLRDAALVRVGNAVIMDTATVAGGYQLTVDDSSGPLAVRLDSIAFGGALPAGVKIIGNVFPFTGLLVPNGTGVWLLRPRAAADLGPQVPNLTISQARSPAAGAKGVIVGG